MYFLNELKHSEKLILNSPQGFQIRFFDRVRAYPLKKFPFLILYVLDKILCLFWQFLTQIRTLIWLNLA